VPYCKAVGRLLLALLLCVGGGTCRQIGSVLFESPRNIDGSGVTVYVFDAGIYADHPEIAGRVRKGFDAYPKDTVPSNIHGTVMAGIIAGKTKGVAPGARIVDVKMIKCDRLRGTVKSVIDAATWVVSDYRKHKGRALASWPFLVDSMDRNIYIDSAASLLGEVGIPVIVAAGNVERDACKISPANAPGVIAVGAWLDYKEPDSTVDTTRMEHSAFGQCVHVYAYGSASLPPVRMKSPRADFSTTWQGTSFSAGYVSGVAALYIHKYPLAPPEFVKRDLINNSIPSTFPLDSSSHRLLHGVTSRRVISKTAPR
jgi:subtilisin family serine protease